MSDALLIVVGGLLVLLAPFDVQVVYELQRVYRRFPSRALFLMRGFAAAIALACIGFAIIGGVAVVERLLPTVDILPTGASLVILLGIAFVLQVPAHLFHREVLRLEREARERGLDDAG